MTSTTVDNNQIEMAQVNTGSGPEANSDKKQVTKSYRKAVTNSLFPKRTQALIIDTVEGIEIKQYLRAIATRTLPTNIIAASKISQNRFCCYLNSETLVEELTKEGNNVIDVNGVQLKMRPYVSKAKRVVLSNVQPFIPHDEIIEKLIEFQITPKSSMTSVKLGDDEPGFTQINSFRRQVFVDRGDINKLPPEITVNYDDALSRIFLSADKITCFLCHQEGHTAKYCPMKTKDSQTQSYVIQPLDCSQKLLSNESTEEDTNPTADNSVSVLNNMIDKPLSNAGSNKQKTLNLEFNRYPLFTKPSIGDNAKAHKRSASTSSLSTSTLKTNTTNENINNLQIKQERKKKRTEPKKDSPVDLQIMVQAAIISVDEEKAATFPITHEQLAEFLTKSYGVKYNEIRSLADNYVRNHAALVVMLQEVHGQITHTEVKKRITRIINNLETNGTDIADIESDASLMEILEHNEPAANV